MKELCEDIRYNFVERYFRTVFIYKDNFLRGGFLPYRKD